MSTALRLTAVLCFALATLNVSAFSVPLVPLGLTLWCASTLVP